MKIFKVVGEFVLYESIGKGQFGSVHLAKKRQQGQNLHDTQLYACKIIPLNSNSIRIEDLEREVDILSSLQHPNIIKLHTVLKTTNNLYLFLDYCDEGDLKQFAYRYFKQNPEPFAQLNITPRFSEKDARYIISQLVEGLKFLNMHNIVHRDIKLDNILVRRKQSNHILRENQNINVKNQTMRIEDYEFKVGDLGLAKAIGSPDDWIQTMCGTPVCMAPEVVAGCLYNYKVDVWSLGTLLFNLLTGTYPFKGKTIGELKENLRKGAYKVPRDVLVSLECLHFLNSCLRFDHSKRKDMHELFNHPFLLQTKLDSIRESKLISQAHLIDTDFNKGGQTFTKTSIEMNTRNSYSMQEVFARFLRGKIDQRIDRLQNQQEKQQIKLQAHNGHKFAFDNRINQGFERRDPNPIKDLNNFNTRQRDQRKAEYKTNKISTFHLQYCQKIDKKTDRQDQIRENRALVKNPICTFHLQFVKKIPQGQNQEVTHYSIRRVESIQQGIAFFSILTLLFLFYVLKADQFL